MGFCLPNPNKIPKFNTYSTLAHIVSSKTLGLFNSTEMYLLTSFYKITILGGYVISNYSILEMTGWSRER